MLYTVGHSNRTLEQFISILHSHQIKLVADIRGGTAGSRMFPHFNSENLVGSLLAAGISYSRIVSLGGRRPKVKGVDDQINGAWNNAAFKNYADYAYTSSEFDEGIARLIELQKLGRCAYMCSEAVPWRCHRSIVSDYLLLIHKTLVSDIISKSPAKPALPHAFAKVSGSKVIYPSMV